MWRRRGRAGRSGRDGLPDAWRDLLDAGSVQWKQLDGPERERLGERADWLLRERRWEAAHGFELTDEVRTIVAAHAGLLVLELGVEWYGGVGAIVVRSGAMREAPVVGRGKGIVTRYPGVIDGETHHGDGPLMVAWNIARREAAQPRFGRDVVLHEFAHKIDMLDGTLDGTPNPAFHDDPDGTARLERWVKVCTNHFEAVREGSGAPVLREYAGTNVAEFFAVATEVFFTKPLEVEGQTPDLYEILADFYRQDTAGRRRRAIASGALPAPTPPRIVARSPLRDRPRRTRP